MKQPAKIDIAVLIIFFNRPKELNNLFKQIKAVRPSKLYLYQDGPRNDNDLPLIEQCRNIVSDSNIDWQCKVQRNYQTVNSGCDPTEYLSQKWAFSHEEKCIVLEDDNVPALSFFPFCKEMLDKYENDERIGIISGINYDEETKEMPSDYFFTTTFSISGWASWKRVVDQWDATYSFLDDEHNRRQLEMLIKERKFQSNFIEFCEYHRSVKKAYYETIFHAALFFNSQLSIVPRVNMISNAGATEGGVHLSGSNDDLPKAIRNIFTMQRHELTFPLKHPRYIIENVAYKDRMFRIMAWGHPWIKIKQSAEELCINLRKGNFKRIKEALIKRIYKLCGKAKWD